jgi:hypothetical protein
MEKKYAFLQIVFMTLFCLGIQTSFGQCDPIVITDEQPYAENFEGETAACWTPADTVGGASWRIVNGSEASGFVFSPGDGDNSEARIVSPILDMSGISSARLSFAYFLYSFYSADELVVSWRSSETDTWHTLGTFNTYGMQDYEEQSYTLENLSSTYQISFLGRGLGGLMDMVANVEIVSSGACARPTSVQVSNLTPTTALLSWTANNGETSWTVDLNGVETPMNTNPFTLTDLIPRTNYTVRVKANCGENNSSDWSSPIEFITDCDIITVTDDTPYFDDFERSENFVCWTSEIISGSDGWVIDPGYLVLNNTAFFIWMGDEARLVSATMDITAVTDPVLVFKHKQPQGQVDVDELSVWYRTAATEEWQQLATYTFPTDGFETETIGLPNPSSAYQIAFKGKSNDAEGIYVDEVAVGTRSAVSVPETSSVTALYPNPTTGNVTIESNAIGADLTVYDLFGKLMVTSKVAAERTELDLSGLATGVYMIQIADITGTTTIKVVKE